MALTHADPNDIIVVVGTGISILITLGCLLSMSLKDRRSIINMKVWSGVAFLIVTVVNLCYTGHACPCHIMLSS